MRRHRLVIAASILLALAGSTTLLWTALDWPPPRLLLDYGLPGGGRPTRRAHVQKLPFVEMPAGYHRVDPPFWVLTGDALGTICQKIGLPWGEQPRALAGPVKPLWVEHTRPFWIGELPVVECNTLRFRPQRSGEDLFTFISAYCSWLDRCEAGSFRLPTRSEWLLAYEADSIVVRRDRPEWVMLSPSMCKGGLALELPYEMWPPNRERTAARRVSGHAGFRLVWSGPHSN